MSAQMQSDSKMLDRRWSQVSVSRTIAVQQEAVWAAIADHKRWLTWYRPLKGFRLLEGDELAIGALVWEHEGPWKTTAEVLEWEEGRTVGLAMRTLNLRGLLSSYYRRIELQAVATDQEPRTEVTITGGFAFGPLGWVLFAYTYPQMLATMYFEYRSALKGLAEAVEKAS